MAIVARHFRPEFINRVDDLIVFHPLRRDEVRRIAQLQVDILARRLEAQRMALEVTPEALDFLGNVGFDPVYGARPLKRIIQQRLENPLAEELLAGRFEAEDTLHAELEQGAIIFTATRS
jgi:ATP-dependent Clp protease ATP-binding subunit ClpB